MNYKYGMSIPKKCFNPSVIWIYKMYKKFNSLKMGKQLSQFKVVP